jgi:hypothetical protein
MNNFFKVEAKVRWFRRILTFSGMDCSRVQGGEIGEIFGSDWFWPGGSENHCHCGGDAGYLGFFFQSFLSRY